MYLTLSKDEWMGSALYQQLKGFTHYSPPCLSFKSGNMIYYLIYKPTKNNIIKLDSRMQYQVIKHDSNVISPYRLTPKEVNEWDKSTIGLATLIGLYLDRPLYTSATAVTSATTYTSLTVTTTSTTNSTI